MKQIKRIDKIAGGTRRPGILTVELDDDGRSARGGGGGD